MFIMYVSVVVLRQSIFIPAFVEMNEIEYGIVSDSQVYRQCLQEV